MANSSSKKQEVLVCLGLFRGSTITIVDVFIPFIVKNNRLKNDVLLPKKCRTEFAKNSLINKNEHQIQTKISTLNSYFWQWFNAKYKVQNSSNQVLLRSFYVRNMGAEPLNF